MNNNITKSALILAGGKSRRMGRDKAAIVINNETLLERAAAFWYSVPGVEKVYIAAGTKEHWDFLISSAKETSILFDCVPVFDMFPDCGPMAGLQAAFLECDDDGLYLSAVDIPNIDISIVPEPDGLSDVIIYTGGTTGKMSLNEPLFGWYSRKALPVAEELLSAGTNRIQCLLDRVNTTYLVLDQASSAFLQNCNTPDDLKDL